MKGYARRAKKEDHEGIKSIIPLGEFDGDYLPDCLPYLREIPLYTDMVYVIDDTIVGYSGIWLIDNGSTAAFTNGRVRKEYQGKGILGILGKELLKVVPKIRWSAYATFINLDQVYKQISRNISRIISVRKCLFFSGVKGSINLTGLQELKERTVTKILSKESLSRIFAVKQLYPNVFHDERLLVFGVAYKIMESNVSIILKGTSRAIASLVENKNLDLLSFGTHFRQPNGNMFCTIELYGPLGETLRHHMILHIEAFLGLVGNNFTIELRFNEYSYIIEQTMNDIGLINLSSDSSRRSECVVTEQSYDLVNSVSKL